MASVEMTRQATAPIAFGAYFVGSEQFRRLFREGMALIEETAAYLEGTGREEARALRRQAALAYATESMRLTTRLMQMASWLLLHRAVADGEISLHEARSEKTRVRLTSAEPSEVPLTDDALPPRLCALLARAQRLFSRIKHLELLLAASEEGTVPVPVAPPLTQVKRLQSVLL